VSYWALKEGMGTKLPPLRREQKEEEEEEEEENPINMCRNCLIP
jgi:hypothetical protein